MGISTTVVTYKWQLKGLKILRNLNKYFTLISAENLVLKPSGYIIAFLVSSASSADVHSS
jgi:hypothetical protein